MDFYQVLIFLVIFFSFIIRNAFGFGAALIAMPIFALTIGIKEGAPLVATCAAINALIILIQNWEKTRFRVAWTLVAFSVPGIFFGLYLLKNINNEYIKIVLSLVLITYSMFSLIYKKKLVLFKDTYAWAFGLVAGVFGGACNTSGPPVILFGILRGWKPEVFRATLQGFFLPSTIILIGGHVASGFWNEKVLQYFFIALPAMFLSFIPGNYMLKKMSVERFNFYIYLLLFGIGAMLFIQVLIRFL